MPTNTDARRWERLSEDTKNAATKLTDPEARRAMLEIAWGYQVLAERARQRGSDRNEGSRG